MPPGTGIVASALGVLVLASLGQFLWPFGGFTLEGLRLGMLFVAASAVLSQIAAWARAPAWRGSAAYRIWLGITAGAALFVWEPRACDSFSPRWRAGCRRAEIVASPAP